MIMTGILKGYIISFREGERGEGMAIPVKLTTDSGGKFTTDSPFTLLLIGDNYFYRFFQDLSEKKYRRFKSRIETELEQSGQVSL